MGNFWADKLAGRTPSPQTAPTGAWWDSEDRPEPPAPLPVERSAYPPARPSQSRGERSGDGMCPECSSSNYMRPSPSAAPRCFDCNFPLLHSTSGAVVGKATPHGKPVRQVTGSGWHPETIIGRIE